MDEQKEPIGSASRNTFFDGGLDVRENSWGSCSPCLSGAKASNQLARSLGWSARQSSGGGGSPAPGRQLVPSPFIEEQTVHYGDWPMHRAH